MLRIRMWLLTVLLRKQDQYIVEEMAHDHLQEQIDRLIDEQHQLQHGG
jgi:hypothetical protein